MRNRLVWFFIVWIVAFPVVGKATLCCHMQLLAAPVVSEVAHCPHHEHAASHVSSHETAQANPEQESINTCHCDYVQHSQFLASLPQALSLEPGQSFFPPLVTLNLPAARIELLYRPPIA